MTLIRQIDLRGAATADPPVDYRAAVPRAAFDVEAATHLVRPIVEEVRTGGVVGSGARGHKKALENYRNRKVD